jgi:lipid II:glycine glycyltransferase (peptidoglycan interpeptide bridge formation enzyme)
MEIKQIKQELTQVAQVINRAAQALTNDDAAPQELKDYIRELDTQSRKARQSRDAEDLVQFIEDMEETSDRAKIACEKATYLGTQAREAVMQTHRQLSDLKHLVH